MTIKKKIFLSLFLLVLVLSIWQWKLLHYAYVQARGQLHIVTNTVPVAELLANPSTPDSIKFKLKLVEEVKKYAVDSLGINPTENYSEVFDQKGKPILWVVTVCEPFELKAKEWSFPIVGSFSYKGFFDYEMAVEEEEKWKAEGYDTGIRTTGGWSTLGWFKDPILSNMLDRNTGDLTELIIHELTHGTLFVRDSVDFNENLATFIGTKGAELFLTHRFGRNSEVLQEYRFENEDYHAYTNHILRGAKMLDSVYQTFSDLQSEEEKSQIKDKWISQVFKTLDTLSLHDKERYLTRFENFNPNNTYFMSYLRYNREQGIFEDELNQHFNGRLKDYLDHLKNKYPSL